MVITHLELSTKCFLEGRFALKWHSCLPFRQLFRTMLVYAPECQGRWACWKCSRKSVLDKGILKRKLLMLPGRAM